MKKDSKNRTSSKLQTSARFKTSTTLKQSAEPLTPDEALAKLENFCAYQERSPREVAEKLRQLGIAGEDAEQILQVLAGDGFFNEERFARAFAGGKFRINEWGRAKIRQELRQRGIPPRLVEQVLEEEIDENEYLRTLQKLAQKKFDSLPDNEDAFKKRQKTGMFLMRCGFEQELIFSILSDF